MHVITMHARIFIERERETQDDNYAFEIGMAKGECRDRLVEAIQSGEVRDGMVLQVTGQNPGLIWRNFYRFVSADAEVEEAFQFTRGSVPVAKDERVYGYLESARGIYFAIEGHSQITGFKRMSEKCDWDHYLMYSDDVAYSEYIDSKVLEEFKTNKL